MKDKYCDEIELVEVLLWIKRKLIFISLVVGLSIVLATLYNNEKKSIINYEGELYFEIGEIIKEKNIPIYKLDLYYDLTSLINKKYGVNAFTYKSSLNIIGIKYINEDRQKVEQKLKDVFNFVIDRHKEKSQYFSNTIPTKQIGNMEIREVFLDNNNLIVLVFSIAGLFSSIILAYLYDVVLKNRKEKQIE